MTNKFSAQKIITWLIAVFALIISASGLFYSCNANKISKEALEYSKDAFVSVNRPYLNVEIVKFKETNSFFSISKKDNLAKIMVRFKLVNKGKVPAANISQSKTMFVQTAPPNKISDSFEVNLGPTFTLGPDEPVYVDVSLLIEELDVPIDTVIKEIASDMHNYDLKMSWFYTSFLDDTKTYKSSVSYNIRNKEAILNSKEMD